MDAETRFRQLEEDLKNAREMISCLNETVKSLTVLTNKPGKDEELHAKMDRILETVAHQNELKIEINNVKGELKGFYEDFSREFVESRKHDDLIKEELKNAIEEIKTSKEIKHLTDTTETSAGYAELFVHDFERIHVKQQEIGGQLDQVTKQMAKQKENDHHQHALLEGMERTASKIQVDISAISENIAAFDAIEDKIKSLDGHMEELTMQKSDINHSNGQIELLKKTLSEVNHKCWYCQRSFSETIKEGEDRIQINCPKCGRINMAGKLEYVYRFSMSTPPVMFLLTDGDQAIQILRNTGTSRIAFKVKTTMPQAVHTNPKVGFIGINGKVKVTVTRNHNMEKHGKIQILYADVSDNVTDARSVFDGSVPVGNVKIPVIFSLTKFEDVDPL